MIEIIDEIRDATSEEIEACTRNQTNKADGSHVNKTCETCLDNDSGFCDRKGILVEDGDSCEKHRGKAPAWKEAMMQTFLSGH